MKVQDDSTSRTTKNKDALFLVIPENGLDGYKTRQILTDLR